MKKDILIILLVVLNLVTLFFTFNIMQISSDQAKVIEGYRKDC